MAFSSITIAWSTRMPIEMAIPDSDMMFDEMPKTRIRMKAIRIDSGSVMTTTKHAAHVRQDQQDGDGGDEDLVLEHRRVTVWIAPSIRRVRS